MKYSLDYENCPRKNEIDAYLRIKRIPELLQSLTCLVLYNQPENPYSYMVEHLQKLQAAQRNEGDNPFIFTLENAESLFDMLDPNANGFISFQQYKHGLETLGITVYDPLPLGIGTNQITKKTFLEEAERGLAFLSSTYENIIRPAARRPRSPAVEEQVEPPSCCRNSADKLPSDGRIC
ncbi:EF-hand calcium-binding domain-containing protein 10 [Sparganum proliferum]